MLILLRGLCVQGVQGSKRPIWRWCWSTQLAWMALSRALSTATWRMFTRGQTLYQSICAWRYSATSWWLWGRLEIQSPTTCLKFPWLTSLGTLSCEIRMQYTLYGCANRRTHSVMREVWTHHHAHTRTLPSLQLVFDSKLLKVGTDNGSHKAWQENVFYVLFFFLSTHQWRIINPSGFLHTGLWWLRLVGSLELDVVCTI